jgi:hypothetical protein
MDLLKMLKPRGTRRGRRDPIRVTVTEPRHRAPRRQIDWMVTPQYDVCPEVDSLGYDLLANHFFDAPAECGTPDPETATVR